MNKKIANPLNIQFTAAEEEPQMKRTTAGNILIPINTAYRKFSDNVFPLIKEHDSVLVYVNDNVDKDAKGAIHNMSIKLNGLVGVCNKDAKPVFTCESANKPFYWMNPSYADKKESSQYAPSDNTILDKYYSFQSDETWQKHQSEIWSRMADMMPLSRKADTYNRDHASQLMDPKRGLEEKDLSKFWSFKSNIAISPAVMGDDMVGMPSIDGRSYDGFTRVKTGPQGIPIEESVEVRSLQTYGTVGIAIPMANANGDVSKHQIAADLNSYNTILHFRASDGKTIGKGELFDKKTRVYDFNFADGTPTKLKAEHVDMNDNITMQDAHGSFQVRPKQEIIDVLKDRGYEIPDLITSVKPEANGKYMWQSPGSMTGSKDVLKVVSPSNPGFIVAREPKNGEHQYDVLVAEGALKGHIVAKYIDVKDNNNTCFGDMISGDRGIIVAQVPGVAKAFVENVVNIYGKYPVNKTYIAMDADGRENRNVALGITSAYECLEQKNPTTVLCWDPAQKGLDDALLAVANGKISIKDMDLVTGTAEELFPIDNTKKMVPHKLEDVTKENTPDIKPKPVADSTPNMDKSTEKIAANIPENLNKKTYSKIEKWNAENLEMEPINTPNGYKSSYQYQQAVIRKENKDLNLSVKPVYQHRGDWGVLNLESDHPIEDEEKNKIRDTLKNSGMVIIGDMKLMYQTLSKDNSVQQEQEIAMQQGQ